MKPQYRPKTHTLNIADKPSCEHSFTEITPIYDEQNQSYHLENTERKSKKECKTTYKSLSIRYDQPNQSYQLESFRENSQIT